MFTKIGEELQSRTEPSSENIDTFNALILLYIYIYIFSYIQFTIYKFQIENRTPSKLKIQGYLHFLLKF